MKWRFRGKDFAGRSGGWWLAAFILAVAHPAAIRGGIIQGLPLLKDTEPAPPGSLVLRGPGAAATTASNTNTNSAAALSVVPTALRLPPDLAEVVRMETAGLGEDTILAYVQNSPPLSPLTPAQIVYLKDLGVTPRLLTAMIQHQRQPAPGNAPPALPGPQSPEVATASEYPFMPAETEEMGPDVAEGYDTAAALPGPGYFNPVEYGYVYNALVPYGSWYNLPGYGWCWQPAVCSMHHAWRPYCDNGRWRWSECGWYWDSNYTWGRVPFHYGRWWQHAQYGWLWRPDSVWAPAWVSWRSSAEHYGWAPLPPGADYSVGRGWTYRGRLTDPAHGGFGLNAQSYTFVNREHFLRPAGHRLGTQETQQAFRQSTPAEHNGFVLGANQRIVNQGIDPFRAETTARQAGRPATVAVNFPAGASFTDTPSGRQLPFNLHRRPQRSSESHLGAAVSPGEPANGAITGRASPGDGTTAGRASPWGSSDPRTGHVPQYSSAPATAALPGAPAPAPTQTPAGGAWRPVTGAKPGLTTGATVKGGTLVFPFGKPGAVSTGPVKK